VKSIQIKNSIFCFVSRTKMNITEETKSGLRLIVTLADREYDALVDATFKILLRRTTEEELSSQPFFHTDFLFNLFYLFHLNIFVFIVEGILGGMDALKVKRGFAALVCLIIEGGKGNVSSMQIKLGNKFNLMSKNI
jgi:hypothetical protein